LSAAHHDPPLAVLVAGIGGQRGISAARLLGEASLRAGVDAAVGQIHGMSQRGGSVQATVLLGATRTAFLPTRGADLLLSLEPLETLRARPSMRAHTVVLSNLGRVTPLPLSMTGQEYPEMDSVMEPVREVVAELHLVDATSLSREAGEPGHLHLCMLGALAATGRLPFADEHLVAVIEGAGNAELRRSKRRAFELGREAMAP
jgi:indolepyruvate ferredoxin oxidoreductase beta subunit